MSLEGAPGIARGVPARGVEYKVLTNGMCSPADVFEDQALDEERGEIVRWPAVVLSNVAVDVISVESRGTFLTTFRRLSEEEELARDVMGL